MATTLQKERPSTSLEESTQMEMPNFAMKSLRTLLNLHPIVTIDSLKITTNPEATQPKRIIEMPWAAQPHLSDQNLAIILHQEASRLPIKIDKLILRLLIDTHPL